MPVLGTLWPGAPRCGAVEAVSCGCGGGGGGCWRGEEVVLSTDAPDGAFAAFWRYSEIFSA